MEHFMDILFILRPFDIFYDYLVYFVVFWNIFPRFGILNQEKSGNPALDMLDIICHVSNFSSNRRRLHNM
jgi:hypothetical protein